MKLITQYELEKRSLHELRAIFRSASTALTRSERGTPERRNALANLDNINRAMNFRWVKYGI